MSSPQDSASHPGRRRGDDQAGSHRRPLLAAAAILLISVTLACATQPSLAFSFVNESDATVTVRVNDRLRLQLRPGEQRSFNTPNNKGNRHVVIIDERGTVRIDRNYAWQELEALGFRVVVR